MFGFNKRYFIDWASFESEALPHRADVYRIAMWLLRNRDQAEDLVQETFVAALGSFHRFEKGTNCRAWLIRIMYNVLGKQRRSANRLQMVADEDERLAETVPFEPPTPQGITESEVLEALKRLPLKFQEVVLLSDIEEMTYKEISAALLIPTGTVMSRLHRARRMLRTELASYAKARGIGSTEKQRSSIHLVQPTNGGKSNAM